MILANHITANIPPVDTSPAAIALRRRARLYRRQDKALAMREAGDKPKAIAEALDLHSADYAKSLAHVAANRRSVAEKLIPHPEPEIFALTEPEPSLLKAVIEVQLFNWDETNASSPDTGWVSRRCRRSGSWSVSCARRRLASHYDREPNPLGIFTLSGNGYIGLTTLGWALAAALHPDLTDQIGTWGRA